MAKGITPITTTNDINAIVRQVNQNFQILANRTATGGVVATSGGASSVKLPGTVTDNSQFAVYYDASGLARVAIGTVASTGEEVIAISSEGVNVLNALKRSPLVASDFYFNSALISASLSTLQTSVDDLSLRLATAEDNISTNTSDISGLGDQVSDLDDRVTALEGRMDDAEDELADHEARITALEGGGNNTPNTPSNP